MCFVCFVIVSFLAHDFYDLISILRFELGFLHNSYTIVCDLIFFNFFCLDGKHYVRMILCCLVYVC
jgi:hypothetical protein